jgi:hypothetical protein
MDLIRNVYLSHYFMASFKLIADIIDTTDDCYLDYQLLGDFLQCFLIFFFFVKSSLASGYYLQIFCSLKSVHQLKQFENHVIFHFGKPLNLKDDMQNLLKLHITLQTYLVPHYRKFQSFLDFKEGSYQVLQHCHYHFFQGTLSYILSYYLFQKGLLYYLLLNSFMQ